MDGLLLFMEQRVFLPLLIAIALGIAAFFRLDFLNAGVISFISLYLFFYIANDPQFSFLLSKSAITFYWVASILGIAVSVLSLVRRNAGMWAETPTFPELAHAGPDLTPVLKSIWSPI